MHIEHFVRKRIYVLTWEVGIEDEEEGLARFELMDARYL